MADAETVRASRSGDRFHYLWASLRALRLLDSTTGLQSVSIEGPTPDEDIVGEEIIDVAEYFGASPSAPPSRKHYHQLKHSSVRVDEPIVSSELSKTLGKFADIYRASLADGPATAVKFSLVTNRRLNRKVRTSLDDLAAGRELSHKHEGQYLRDTLGFESDTTAEQQFWQQFTVDDGTAGVVDVERTLGEELKSFIPGGGTGSELADLLNHVSRMATYEAKSNVLTRHDLLLTLRTTDDRLFPAMPALEELTQVIRTADVDTVAARLRAGDEPKLLLTALGGVGKSVFTGLLREELASDSLVLVFDSFAGGDYRKIGRSRHQHKVALTQLANELASKGLCTTLIPSQIADHADYVRAFERKVDSACKRLAITQPGTFLTIAIDAADNAVMAATKFGERPFVADLFEIEWPSNFRLIALCRPERKDLLKLPGEVPEIALAGFGEAQTLAHMRTRFSTASESDGSQLHALSSGNPRVQAMAMEGAATAGEAIEALQIATIRPGQQLDILLAEQVQKVASQEQMLPDELKRLCQALAIMHPTIPLADLAKVADVGEDTIRSFAVALGRGLHFNNNSLQFRDEPTETWFTATYELTTAEMRDFATRVIPYASDSPYIATVLPQLLFEAHMIDELVELALSDSGLPAKLDDLQAQEIARSRARFALGAALRAKRNGDAALLSVKAGTLSSGHSRRMKMFRSNPDLSAKFLDQEVVDALCSGRELAAEWPGSNLHVEAVMLSSLTDQRDLSRAHYTASRNTIGAILRLEEDARNRLGADIGRKEVSDLALTITNLDGPSAGARFMTGWRPHGFVRRVSAQLASRLADAGRTDQLSELITAAYFQKHIQIGVAETMFDYGIVPSADATAALVEMLRDRKKPFRGTREPHIYEWDLRGVIWSLLHAVRLDGIDAAEALRILDIHLEPLKAHAGEHWSGPLPTSCLLGHALRARLLGRSLGLEDVVAPELFDRIKTDRTTDDRSIRSFKANIPPLLPWARCLVDTVIDGPVEPVRQALIELATTNFTEHQHYETPFVRLNGLADLAIRTLVLSPEPKVIVQFEAWHEGLGVTLTRSQLTAIRCAAREPALAAFAIAAANRAVDASQKDRTNADERVDELIEVARAVLATSVAEARAIFNIADREAKLVGEDLYARWYALTNAARRLDTGAEPERAYRLLQIGETLDTSERMDVSQLATALFPMHPPTYYAAASRQRDRRGLSFDRLLGPIMESAAGPSGPIGALAVTALGAPADWESITGRLTTQDAARLNSVHATFTRYMRSSGDVPQEEDRTDSSRDWLGPPEAKPAMIWTHLDFSTTNGWDDLFAQVHWYSDARAEAVRRGLQEAPAKLPDTLRALADSKGSREEDFVTAAAYASTQTPTAGLRESVAHLVDVFADRFASGIATRWYDPAELNGFAEVAGISPRSLLEAGFYKLGARAHTLKPEEYFGLASHVARTLDIHEAGLVFDALASLFDDLAPPATAADGPYSGVPTPPTNPATCLAGLIWASLADMAIARRWQAAQAVLLLVQIGDQSTLNELAGFAAGTTGPSPFHDARFPRYELHARMWFLFALERAGSDPNAQLLSTTVPWMCRVIDGPPHAVNQVLAQRALQILADSGVIEQTPEISERLSRRLIAEWEELDWEERRSRKDPLAGEDGAGADDDSHPFFFDFQSHWARDLGRAFGTTEQRVATKTLAIAADLTGFSDRRDDPRLEAGVYGETGSYFDHRSWPDQDDFSFYSAVHSLLTLGADFAQQLRALKEPGSQVDEYTSWLIDFMPKRRDGRWLSDRRDPPPVPAPELRIAAGPADTWRWSLTPAAFETVVGHGTDWIVVDASYDAAFKRMSEDVDISSALVDNSTAQAYLIALQTNTLGGPGRLPTTDDHDGDLYRDELEIGSFFRPVPWIDASHEYESIDRYDECGRNVVFPPSRPGIEVVNRFGLTPDSDLRAWSNQTGEVFRSQVWNDAHQTGQEYWTGTSGQTLAVSAQFLTELLTELEMTMVIQVGLRRDVIRSSYERKESDEVGWVERSHKFYLIDSDGRWTEY